MSLKSVVSKHGSLSLAALGLAALLASPAAAQTAPDPNPGNLTVTSSVDLTNVYMFRGIRQDDTKLIVWPTPTFFHNAATRSYPAAWAT